MSKRAERRHHSKRMKAKAKRVFPNDPKGFTLADHMAMCSCGMCGNPRKWNREETFQEKKKIDIEEVED